MKQDAKRELKPKLRFPEFQGEPEWKAEKLGSVASLITERAGNKKCIPMSITSGVGLVSQQEKFGRIIAGNQYKNYLVLQKNDFAYNKSATKEFPQGFIAKYSGDEPAAVPNSIFTCFRAREDGIVPDFLNYLFLGNLHGKWLKKYIEVSARAHGSLSIDDEDLMSLPIPLPSGESSRAEQKQIAECLTSLDEMIAAHSQKLDALTAHKKGLMQQLFPPAGETLPSHRFPEFQNNPEWVNKPLSELGEIVTGKTPSTKEAGLWGGDILFITPTDISEDGKYQHNTQRKVVETKSTKVLPVGSVVYTCIASIGKMAITVRASITNQQINAVVANASVANEFVYYSLANMTPWIKSIPASSTLAIINKTEFSKICVTIPEDRAEQQAVVDCFSSLDELIAAYTQKLDALKTHKKGLMQQLFPSPEEIEA